MNTKLRYLKILRELLEVLLLIGHWCLIPYINCFYSSEWNQLAFVVPVTVINLIVVDVSVIMRSIQLALLYEFFPTCCTYEIFNMLHIFTKATIVIKFFTFCNCK